MFKSFYFLLCCILLNQVALGQNTQKNTPKFAISQYVQFEGRSNLNVNEFDKDSTYVVQSLLDSDFIFEVDKTLFTRTFKDKDGNYYNTSLIKAGNVLKGSTVNYFEVQSRIDNIIGAHNFRLQNNKGKNNNQEEDADGIPEHYIPEELNCRSQYAAGGIGVSKIVYVCVMSNENAFYDSKFLSNNKIKPQKIPVVHLYGLCPETILSPVIGNSKSGKVIYSNMIFNNYDTFNSFLQKVIGKKAKKASRRTKSSAKEQVYNTTLVNPNITSITPKALKSGTNDVLTINGTNFGQLKGRIMFRKAESGSASVPIRYFYCDTSDIKIWTPTQIKVLVSSLTYMPQNPNDANKHRFGWAGKCRFWTN